jgi:DNA-directed RNA polymerase specialized sigma24 family protein
VNATLELAHARDTRAAAAAQAREARETRRAAVLAARAEGFTLTEIADILGVSYQRVWQIASTNPPAEES